MSDEQNKPTIQPKADPPVTLQQQALELKGRMQALQDQVAVLLDEFAAADLTVNMNIAGPPVQAKHRIVVEVIKKF